jgi:carboxymethylenebutenolidase
MKKLIFLVAVTIYAGASAQVASCCVRNVTEQNNLLAMNTEFVASHLPPLPFILADAKGQIVLFKTPDGKNGRAYVVKSEKPTNKVVFMFHEWWGLNDYIKREADNLRNELGDADVYALDLYDGEVATTAEEAQKLMKGLKDERARAIIKGALVMAGEKAKIASIGWCMGGMWSMQSALLEGKQAIGCVMYYGMPENDLKKLKTLNCDIIGFFGTRDKFINPDVVKKFQDDMKAAGKKIEVHNYDAVHAFANPSNPKYDKTSADDAHAKAILYLKERLK